MTTPRRPMRMRARPLRTAALALPCLALSLASCADEPRIATERTTSVQATQAAHLVAPVHPVMQVQRVLSYPYEQVWPTAIRYLRVDRGYKIADRDADAGYVLFEFGVGDERTGNGSLEVFRTEDSAGRPSVRVSVSTGAGPAYLPNAIADGLAAKVRAERGQPAPPPEAPPESPPDDGEDEGKDLPGMEDPIQPNGPIKR